MDQNVWWSNVILQKYVDYYQVIREPVDLRIIAQKIQSQSYPTLDDMHKDLMLLIQNAKYFNKPSSLIYKVTDRLLSIFCSVGESE